MPSVALLMGSRIAARIALASRRKHLTAAGLRGGIPPARIAWVVCRAARVVLCSGSYVFVDVSVPSERLRVRVRLI
jgi:hypothetical protein